MKELSLDDYVRLILLIKDFKRNINNGEIKIKDKDLKDEFVGDLNYFYELFNLTN